MKSILKTLSFVLALSLALNAFGQAPNISYSTGTVAVTPGLPVSLTPNNAGGMVPGSQYINVSTFAGSNSGLSGTAGYVNGTGTAALFNDPRDMAFDAYNNLYVADAANNCIRRITPAGVVTTFAGSPTGAAGLANGTGTSALFNFPDGLIFDNAGNLLVADYNNYAIREITPAGVVSTFFQGEASYFNPTGMCFTNYDQLWVILKTSSSPTGTNIYDVPENGNSVGLIDVGYMNSNYNNFFTDIKQNASGNIYITDTGMNEIDQQQAYAPVSIAGNYTATTFSLTGVGKNATFTQPTSVQVMADGTLYITDLKNNDIRKIAPDTTVSLLAGYVPLNGSGFPTQQPGYVDGAIANAQFNQPAYIRADSKGNLYVSEWGAGGNRIRKISLSGFFLSGPPLPVGLTLDPQTGTISGNPTAKVAIAQTDTVTAINASGTSVTTITFTPGASIKAPAISYSTAISKITAGTTYSFSPANSGGAVPAAHYGQVSIFAGSPTEQVGYINLSDTSARFSFPQEMVTDASGNIYVADAGNNAIRKITPGGLVTTFAGDIIGSRGYVNGTGTVARFDFPNGLAIDASGNLYTSDYNNNAIRKITPSAVVTTFYDSGGAIFGPAGLCFDNKGNLIVAAQDTSLILSINPSGVATVIAGSSSGYTNAKGKAAKFNEPTDVRVDTLGNIYVVDYQNNAIRKISTAGVVTTFAGSNVNGNKPGYKNGVGTAAVFNNPTGLVFGPGGVIYVADFYNNDIRRVMPNGAVSLVAGSSAQVPGDADGIGTAAGLYTPVYMYIDGSGNGYISEDAAERIRKITLTGYTLQGTLPTGLSFDGTTGIISGTPTSPIAGLTDTVTAYNAGGYSTTIIKFDASLTFAAIPTQVYGAADFSPGATSTAPITYTSSNAAVATIVNGLIHIVGQGVSNIKAANGTSSIIQKLTVNKAPLTITANDTTKVAGQVNPGFTASYSGFAYSETSASLTTQPTIKTTATTSSPAGTYPITASAAVDPNYTITYVAGTLTVTAPTLSFPAIPTQTYGAADFDPGATSNSTITYTSSNTAIATIVNGLVHIVGPGVTFIKAAVTTTNIIQKLTITKAPLTITANNLSKVSGQANPTLTVSYSGFVNDETPVSLTTQPTVKTTATTSSPAGTYPITASGAVDPDYAFTYVTGTLTVGLGLDRTNGVIPVADTMQTADAYNVSAEPSVRPAVSPNGDGINDVLTIDHIENYPDNNLVIVGVSGNAVYKVSGYDNVRRIFDGHSNITGKLLTAGTYFYVLNFKDNNGIKKTKTGYILLKY